MSNLGLHLCLPYCISLSQQAQGLTDNFAGSLILAHGRNPRLGHKRSDLTKAPVRFLTVRRSYMVVYQSEEKRLVIVRIHHGARDASAEI